MPQMDDVCAHRAQRPYPADHYALHGDGRFDMGVFLFTADLSCFLSVNWAVRLSQCRSAVRNGALSCGPSWALNPPGPASSAPLLPASRS